MVSCVLGLVGRSPVRCAARGLVVVCHDVSSTPKKRLRGTCAERFEVNLLAAALEYMTGDA